MLAQENFTVYAPKLRVRRTAATARIARFRSFPTMPSCAARWCPGVVRLIMDGVQPAKVSDLDRHVTITPVYPIKRYRHEQQRCEGRLITLLSASV